LYDLKVSVNLFYKSVAKLKKGIQLQYNFIHSSFKNACIYKNEIHPADTGLSGAIHIQGDGRCSGQWQDVSKSHGERSIHS
jgi:hypothetical protein